MFVAILTNQQGKIIEATGPYDTFDAACQDYKIPEEFHYRVKSGPDSDGYPLSDAASPAHTTDKRVFVQPVKSGRYTHD